MINRIAEFLKTRDESVLPEEIDEAERIGSARAVLELMREPTDDMKKCGCAHDDPLGGLVDWRGSDVTTREAVSGVYTAMIDAALKETT